MKILTASSLALLTLLAPPNQDQGDDPPPLPVGGTEESGDAAGPPLPEPGTLPADATPEARELWLAMCAATLAPGRTRRPVESFRLSFDLRWRPSDQQSNDVHATYSFLAPKGFVRYSLESGREHVRGPEGDWMIDGENKVKLVGREFGEDRRQIDEAVRIARNFVSLTDPSRLRISKLELAKPVKGLPQKLVTRASKLTWLRIESPDFHLYRTDGKPQEATTPVRSFQVDLGLDPATKRIEVAKLSELGSPRTAPVLIHFSDFRAMDDFMIPHGLLFYELEPRSKPLVFRNLPTSDLVLLKESGTLRAELGAKDFQP